MKTFFAILVFLASLGYVNASSFFPADTTFHYQNRMVVIREQPDEINVSVYRCNEAGDTIRSNKIYEGIFTDNKSVERRYENRFDIFVPDIFKPKEKRKVAASHWAGFGIGFSNLPNGFDFDGEIASALNLSRSLQYNLNFFDNHWRLGNNGFSLVTGFGIQFNSLHLQNNKYMEVMDYKTVISTSDEVLHKSRLHFTCLTFPLLLEVNFPVGCGETIFLNAGVVGKIKTASSSKIWLKENGKERKVKQPGELNIRPLAFDLLMQAGIGDVGFFLSYSPFTLFLNNKGPQANQGTIGIQLYF
ncbi:hypothetical protein [Proteiniphilum sp. UBA1028]|jgi:hypothetical protein|uniref:hypothetical protein n=1 Tax=Proteiniphilum sp. UBA1028 TaxID=1947251 RepID=UPI0026005D62|nr:hypothetical protein [Proteiniphilum sp. UBA1028]